MKNHKLNSLDQIDKDFGLVIGNFDGFHLGHKSLISNFTKKCDQRGLLAVVLTFSPHPNIFLGKVNSDFLISSEVEKENRLVDVGVDIVVNKKFDEELRSLDASEFFEKFLYSNKKLKYIHVGHDFKLGKGKSDAYSILLEGVSNNNIEVEKENSFKIEDTIVSSSFIRKCLKENFNELEKYLGRRFSLKGEVVEGRGIGRKKLFPTANLDYNPLQIIPEQGVYITRTKVDGIYHQSVTNIGINPTIKEGNNISIESFLIFHSENLYWKEIEVEFIEKIREEKKFDSLEALREQISKDVEKTKKYFRKNSKIKLALIGKEISHSKSQEMYEKILNQAVNYNLIDCKDRNQIPCAEELLKNYDGVSITAPYKKHFLDSTEVNGSNLDSVNVLYKENESIKSTNTDLFAIRNLLERFKSEGVRNFIILGSGSMAKLLRGELSGTFVKEFSRKDKNLSKIDKENFDKTTLVINACSREYVYSGPTGCEYTFWDLNYNLEHHENLFANSSVKYIDGTEMLLLQAKYALSYWNLTK